MRPTPYDKKNPKRYSLNRYVKDDTSTGKTEPEELSVFSKRWKKRNQLASKGSFASSSSLKEPSKEIFTDEGIVKNWSDEVEKEEQNSRCNEHPSIKQRLGFNSGSSGSLKSIGSITSAPRSASDSTSTSDHSSGNKREIETDPEVLKRRAKQISYGKNTNKYAEYLEKVPKRSRTRFHLRTPDIKLKVSRRNWDGRIKQWRLNLHNYEKFEQEQRKRFYDKSKKNNASWDRKPGKKAHDKKEEPVEVKEEIPEDPSSIMSTSKWEDSESDDDDLKFNDPEIFERPTFFNDNEYDSLDLDEDDCDL